MGSIYTVFLTTVGRRGVIHVALLKCHSLINIWQGTNQRYPIYYRGQTDFARELLPRIAWKAGLKPDPNDLLKPTHEEIRCLKSFQTKVKEDNTLGESIFRGVIPDEDDPIWWTVAAHHDGDNGTRMIDITSSIFCALYFACASWDGEVNTDLLSPK